jgi:hypothetical protein
MWRRLWQQRTCKAVGTQSALAPVATFQHDATSNCERRQKSDRSKPSDIILVSTTCSGCSEQNWNWICPSRNLPIPFRKMSFSSIRSIIPKLADAWRVQRRIRRIEKPQFHRDVRSRYVLHLQVQTENACRKKTGLCCSLCFVYACLLGMKGVRACTAGCILIVIFLADGPTVGLYIVLWDRAMHCAKMPVALCGCLAPFVSPASVCGQQ